MKKKERTNFEIIKRFIQPYTKNRIVTLKGTIFYSIWAIGGIYHIYFIEKVVYAIENKNLEDFKYIMLLYIIAMVAYYTLGYVSRMWGWVITVCSFRKIIHKQYLDDFIKLSNTETEKIGTGKLIAIIGSGMDTWSIFLDLVLHNFIKIVLTILFTFYMIGRVNMGAAVVFIIFYILVYIIGEYFNKKSLIHRRRRNDSWNNYTGTVVKMIMSKFEILQTGKTKTEIGKVDNITNELVVHNRAMATPTHWFYYTPSIFINVVKIGMFGFLGYQVILGNESLSLFVLLYGTLTLMNSVIVSSMQFYSNLTSNFTKIEKLWDFFDSTPNIKGYNTGKEFQYDKGSIEIKNLGFGYNEKQKVFENFNLSIKGGKITALVGNSGSGKSTLVKLISGYIRQDSGKIKVDGQNLEKVSLKSYYKNIGYLTQEPSVFDGSIYNNLIYAVDRELKEGELTKVIKQAKCDFIYELEDGIQTEIGEKGIRLSGGQRQRLAIAKIFLKDPQIIILDEPTSALDSFSEEQITKAMHNLFTGRTVIIIAHRLQTVKNADKILVLESGKVTEEGTHSQLVKQKGIYKKMLDLQSGF